MGVGMTRVLHVKIPVTGLQRNADWYAQLMDLVLTREFIEDDELRGAALYSPEVGFAFALRLRGHCSSQPGGVNAFRGTAVPSAGGRRWQGVSKA